MSEIAYDHLHIITPKGKKTIIQNFAASQGKSLNAFVNQSIDEKIERDTKKMRQMQKKLKEEV